MENKLSNFTTPPENTVQVTINLDYIDDDWLILRAKLDSMYSPLGAIEVDDLVKNWSTESKAELLLRYIERMLYNMRDTETDPDRLFIKGE